MEQLVQHFTIIISHNTHEVLCSSTSFATYHYSPQIPASAISRRAGDQKLIIDLVWPNSLAVRMLVYS